jgi:hypothetical protein
MIGQNSTLLGKADHTAGNQQIQHSVYMPRLTLVGFDETKTGAFLIDYRATN